MTLASGTAVTDAAKIEAYFGAELKSVVLKTGSAATWNGTEWTITGK